MEMKEHEHYDTYCVCGNSSQTFLLMLMECFLFKEKSYFLALCVIFFHLRVTTLKAETRLTLCTLQNTSTSRVSAQRIIIDLQVETFHSTWLCYILITLMKLMVADCRLMKKGT